MRTYRAAKKTDRMEVNHRVPCRGKHGKLSCDHHLENLETLCPSCHSAHTRAIGRDVARVRVRRG